MMREFLKETVSFLFRKELEKWICYDNFLVKVSCSGAVTTTE